MYLLWLVEWAVRAFFTLVESTTFFSNVHKQLAPGVSFAPLVVGLLVILFFHSLISGAGDRL